MAPASAGAYKPREVPVDSVEAFMRKQVARNKKGVRNGVKGRDMPEIEHAVLTSNAIVQIEHKDSLSYLQAEGKYAWKDSGRLNDCFSLKNNAYLHCGSKEREASNPKTTALTYFKIEKEKATEGGAILWEDPIRLRHLPTGLYLTVNSTFDTELLPLQTDSLNADNALFKMVPFLRTAETSHTAHSSTLFRLQNCTTGVWVCGDDEGKHSKLRDVVETTRSAAMKLKKLQRKGTSHKEASGVKQDSLRPGTASLDKSVSTLHKTRGQKIDLGTCHSAPFKDTFEIKLVKDKAIHGMGFVSGCLPALHEYVVHKRTGKGGGHALSNGCVADLLTLLKEMNDFLYKSEIPQPSRQKMYRDFKVIDLLIEMLQAPYSIPCGRPEASHLLSSFDATDSTESSDVAQVNDAIFLVLESYLKGSSRKNELYIAKHIPLFWNMLGTTLEVESMFTELVRDNNILVSFFDKEHIQVVIDLLKKPEGQNSDYLTFLSVLCVCTDRPRRNLQKIIGDLLFNDVLDPKKHPFLYTTTVNPKEGGDSSVRVTSGNIKQNITLAQFFQSGMDGDTITTTKDAMFLNRQLLLFGRLCRGRNMANIRIISEHYVPWDECLLCAQKADLPFEVRTYYTRVLMNIYVDVDPNRDVLSEVQLNYEWEKICADPSSDSAARDPTKSISGASFPHFKEVHHWIKEILQNNSTLFYESGSEKEKGGSARQKNEYIAGVLRLLHKLVIFGYYSNLDHIHEVLDLLIRLLDGETDQLKSGRKDRTTPSSGADNWAHKRSGLAAKAVHECKHQALLCVDGLLNFSMHSRIRLVLARFKEVFLALPEERGSPFWGVIAHETILALTARHTTGKDFVKYSPPPSTRLKKKHPWRKGNNKVAAAEAFAASANANANVERATAAAMSAEDNDADVADDQDPAKVMLNVMKLAIKVVREMEKGGTTDIIVPPAVEKEAYKVTALVRKYLNDLTRVKNWTTGSLPRVLLDLAQYNSITLRESSLNILYRIFTLRKNEFALEVQGRVLMSQQTIALSQKAYGVEVGVPSLKLWSQGGFYMDADADSFVGALNSLSMDCFHRDLILGADHLKQRVLYNAGVHTIALDIIRTAEPTKPKVLQACFNFLASLIDGFALAQAEIYKELDMILNIHRRKEYNEPLSGDEQGFEPWQNALGRLLSMLFAHNVEASLGIHSSQIELILELIALWTWKAPQLLTALTMVSTSQEWNIPLRRNQEVIVLNLWKKKVTVLDSSHIGVVANRDSREINRMAMLETPRCGERVNMDEKQCKLEYHINLIDLLASACAGKSCQIEAKCRRLLALDEVVTTLKSNIPPINKGPYMTFLMWVHLNAELQSLYSDGDDGGSADDADDAYEAVGRLEDTDVLEMLAAAKETSISMVGPYARALSGDAGGHDDISMSGRRERYFIFDQYIPFITCLLSMDVDWFLDGHDIGVYIETIVQEVANLVVCTRNQATRTGAKLGKFRSYRIKELVKAVQKAIHAEVPIQTFTSKTSSAPKPNELSVINPDVILRIEKQVHLLQEGYQTPPQRHRPSAIVRMDTDVTTDVVMENDEGMEEVELDVNTLFNAFVKVLQTSYESKNTIEAQLRFPSSRGDDADTSSSHYEDGDAGDDPLRSIDVDKCKLYADDEFGLLPLGWVKLAPCSHEKCAQEHG